MKSLSFLDSKNKTLENIVDNLQEEKIASVKAKEDLIHSLRPLLLDHHFVEQVMKELTSQVTKAKFRDRF